MFNRKVPPAPVRRQVLQVCSTRAHTKLLLTYKDKRFYVLSYEYCTVASCGLTLFVIRVLYARGRCTVVSTCWMTSTGTVLYLHLYPFCSVLVFDPINTYVTRRYRTLVRILALFEANNVFRTFQLFQNV